MLRRKVAVLLLSVAGLVGVLSLPAPSDAAKGSAPSSNSQGNGPKQERCDPQPEHGNGPPPGKGKKCASR